MGVIMKEVWKEITGYKGSYSVSNLGRVRSEFRIIERLRNNKINFLPIRERILKQRITKHGYCAIKLSKDGKHKNYLVHVLVCAEFIGLKPTKSDVNHIDCVKTNNNLDNLEYCTRSENIIHAYANGLRPFKGGSNSWNSQLTEKEAIEIYNDTNSQSIIAKKYGVSKSTVKHIKKKRSWKHIHK